MSNDVRTIGSFFSLIPPKELSHLVDPPDVIPSPELSGMSDEEIKAMDAAALAAFKGLPALDKKCFTPKVFGGAETSYCSYAKKEPTSEADVRSKLQQKAEAKGIELSSEHLDKLVAALKSTDPLPDDISAFLLFINNT